MGMAGQDGDQIFLLSGRNPVTFRDHDHTIPGLRGTGTYQVFLSIHLYYAEPAPLTGLSRHGIFDLPGAVIHGLG